MNSLVRLLCILIVISISTNNIKAQLFYGSSFTGQSTVGVSVKYDGDWSMAGTYNFRDFTGLGNDPLDYNAELEIPLSSNNAWYISAGINQKFIPTNTNTTKFGTGLGLNLKYEVCPENTKLNLGCAQRLSFLINAQPGFFSTDWAIYSKLQLNAATFRIGCDDDEDFAANTFASRLALGIGGDWTNTKSGNGRLHAAGEVGYNIRLDGLPYDGEIPKVLKDPNDCFEENRLYVKSGLNIRF